MDRNAVQRPQKRRPEELVGRRGREKKNESRRRSGRRRRRQRNRPLGRAAGVEPLPVLEVPVVAGGGAGVEGHRGGERAGWRGLGWVLAAAVRAGENCRRREGFPARSLREQGGRGAERFGGLRREREDGLKPSRQQRNTVVKTVDASRFSEVSTFWAPDEGRFAANP